MFGDSIKEATDDSDVETVVGNLIEAFRKMKVKVPKTKAAKAKGTKKRKKSAYNVFVKEMFRKEEIQELPNRERFGALGKIWKSYGEEEKAEWQEKANKINEEEAEEPIVVEEESIDDEGDSSPAVEKVKKKRGKSGYNVFVQNMSKSEKIQEVPGKERFKELGTIWSSYQDEDKEKWKEQAKLINSGDSEGVVEGLKRTEEGYIKME